MIIYQEIYKTLKFKDVVMTLDAIRFKPNIFSSSTVWKNQLDLWFLERQEKIRGGDKWLCALYKNYKNLIVEIKLK